MASRFNRNADSWGKSITHFRIFTDIRARGRRSGKRSRKNTTKNNSMGGGKFLAHFGRVLLASLFLFSGINKYHALVSSNSISDFHLLERSIAPRFAETRTAMSASLATYLFSSEKEIMEQLLLVDDATVAMCGTLVELLGAVLLLCNFTLGSKLLAVFVSCVTPIMHPFWRREVLSASREIETIMFWKNVALFGALIMHVGMSKEEAKEEKEKEE